MDNNAVQQEKRGRGRPRKHPLQSQSQVNFDPNTIKLFRGNDLYFNDSLFVPIKTNLELDIIFSTEGGIMPATNMVIAGGPGGGKTTIVLDVLSSITNQGYKCLYVSAEMDEIQYYKYCKRLPHIKNVQTLFLKNYSHNVKETLEYILV